MLYNALEGDNCQYIQQCFMATCWHMLWDGFIYSRLTSSQNFAPFLFAQAFHQEAGEQEVGSAGNLYLCTVYKITEQLSGGSNT